MPDRTQAIPPAARRQAPAPPAQARRRSAARRRFGNFIAGLAILAAGALVALAIIQASGSSSDNRVNEDNVHDQAVGIEAYVRDHSR
jgi:ferric-dicitrate binding protein FerR (iron transport regulator)